MTDCHAESPRVANGNSAWTFTECQDCRLVNCSAREASEHGFEVLGRSSAAFQFIGCSSINPGSYGYHLEDVAGVILCACMADGGVQGVNCDSGRPPTGVRVVACRFTGQADRSVKNPPALTAVLGTTEQADLSIGDRLPGPIGFFGTEPTSRPSVAGSRGGNEALTALLSALSNLGLISDDTLP